MKAAQSLRTGLQKSCEPMRGISDWEREPMQRTVPSVRTFRRNLAHGLILGLLLAPRPAFAQPTQCPNLPPVTISPQLPSDVCIPTGFTANPIRFFDDFSWRSFIAMVWPVQQGQRGVPDTSKSIGPVSGPLVFETFKAEWEVFQPSPGGTSPPPAPSPWNSYAGQNPCSNSRVSGIAFSPDLVYPIFSSDVLNIGFGDVVLASFSKFGNLGQAAGFGPLVGPLPAQNGIYTRYSTAFNRIEFDQILGQGLYLRANLPPPGSATTFQDGAIDIKAAWIDMTNVPNPGRYYTRTAWVMNPFTTPNPTCTQITVGLVGLHIVQKTPSRPQWIWSTFEQIDNVPQSSVGPPAGPFTYNNGDGTPMPTSNPNPFPPPATPTVFNVQRLTPIHPSTANTNTQYRSALQANGGPWQFYQLVMTQWPLQPSNPSLPGTPVNTFPGSGATSAFANVALETFDQTSIGTGCMNCHNLAKRSTDFVFSLENNAWPSSIAPPSTRILALPSPALAPQKLSPTLELLKELMQSGATR